MDPFSSQLSPFTCFEINGYIPNHCYNASVDVNKGEFNGIVEQDNSRSNHASINKQLSRKRSTKADRHSKIPTARGLRDRRMRLSLDVARQFFKLHDMLSYDKPSDTVKWLLLQAEASIDELMKKNNQSSITASEVVENTDYTVRPKAKCSKTRKNAFNPEAKELRNKAREKARERTQKKKMAVACMFTDPRSYFEIGEDSSSQSQAMKPSLDVLYKIEQQIEDERILFGIPEDFTVRSFL